MRLGIHDGKDEKDEKAEKDAAAFVHNHPHLLLISSHTQSAV